MLINIKIAIIITRTDGVKEINNGLISKLRAIAPPIREINSKDNPIATPKNIFLPKVASRLDPKINSIASKIIAIRDIGLTSLLYNSTSKTPALNLFSVKYFICFIKRETNSREIIKRN